MDINEAVATLRPAPFVTGEVLADEADAVKIRAGGAIFEIPRRYIKDRRDTHDGVRLMLDADAVIVVSTIVKVGSRFVVADVFGSLGPGISADNCNCNCNCSGGNCNCNCNCECGNCDCGGSGCAGGSILERPDLALDTRRFRVAAERGR